MVTPHTPTEAVNLVCRLTENGLEVCNVP